MGAKCYTCFSRIFVAALVCLSNQVVYSAPQLERTLYIYVFEGAPLAASAQDHINRAVEIWKAAGITFKPKIQNITGAQVKTLLGDDKQLQSFAGETDRDDEPGATERRNLSKLKSSPQALGVFFVSSTWMSRADPSLFQVYIDQDLGLTPKGRTVAHEIGHLLLGAGHTGNPGVAWTSELMRGGGTINDGVSIDDADAVRARQRATQIPQ